MTSGAARSLRAAMIALCLAAPAAKAEDGVAAFYRGKTLRIINPFAETGFYGALTRALADVLPRHLPGRPGARGEAMPGGGGLQGANYIYAGAPRDGAAISILYDNMPTAQALALDDLARFDARKYTVLGSVNRGDTGVVGVMKRAGIGSVADARVKVAVMGATGAGAAQYFVPLAMNRLLGTKFNIIPGYRTVSDTFLAMDAGEADGLFSNYVTIAEARPQWIADKAIEWIAQSLDHADPDFPGVPLLQDLTDDNAKRDAFRFLAMSRSPGKIIVAPPDVPADRAEALRTALAETFRDPEFVADVARMNQKIAPRTAAEAAEIIRATVEVDAATLASVRDLMRDQK